MFRTLVVFSFMQDRTTGYARWSASGTGNGPPRGGSLYRQPVCTSVSHRPPQHQFHDLVNGFHIVGELTDQMPVLDVL